MLSVTFYFTEASVSVIETCNCELLGRYLSRRSALNRTMYQVYVGKELMIWSNENVTVLSEAVVAVLLDAASLLVWYWYLLVTRPTAGSKDKRSRCGVSSSGRASEASSSKRKNQTLPTPPAVLYISHDSCLLSALMTRIFLMRYQLLKILVHNGSRFVWHVRQLIKITHCSLVFNLSRVCESDCRATTCPKNCVIDARSNIFYVGPLPL